MSTGLYRAGIQPRASQPPTVVGCRCPRWRANAAFPPNLATMCCACDMRKSYADLRQIVNVECVTPSRDIAAMEHVTAKLRALRERAGYSMPVLAREMGYRTPSGYQRYESAEQHPKAVLPLPLIQKLLRPLTGRGDPPIRAAEVLALALPPALAAAGLAEEPPPDMIAVQSLDVDVSAGGGTLVDQDEVSAPWWFRRDVLEIEIGAPAESLRIVRVKGDSMTPTLSSSDRVMVDTSDRVPSPPGIFVLWDGLGTVVKRVEHVPNSDPPQIRIMSDNDAYSDYVATDGEAHIMGRVVWFARRL